MLWRFGYCFHGDTGCGWVLPLPGSEAGLPLKRCKRVALIELMFTRGRTFGVMRTLAEFADRSDYRRRPWARATWLGVGSGDQGFDYLAGYVGQAEVAALKFEGEAAVVETHQLEYGGMQIVYVDSLAGHVEA